MALSASSAEAKLQDGVADIGKTEILGKKTIMQKALLRSLGVAIFIVGTVPLSADVLDFSSLSQSGNSFVDVGNSLTGDGLTFSSGTGDFYAWEASSANLPSGSVADTSLFEYYANATTLTSYGGAFALNSIDLAPLIEGGAGTFDVTFTGTHADSTTISQTFTVSDSPDELTTFDFSGGFTDLVSVSFTQGTNSGFFAAQDTAYQFDNFNFTPGPTRTVVPEPSSVILLLTTLLAVGFVARKCIAKGLKARPL
jgi:hypothetical protein